MASAQEIRDGKADHSEIGKSKKKNTTVEVYLTAAGFVFTVEARQACLVSEVKTARYVSTREVQLSHLMVSDLYLTLLLRTYRHMRRQSNTDGHGPVTNTS